MDVVIAGIVIVVVMVALLPFAWRFGQRQGRIARDSGDSGISDLPSVPGALPDDGGGDFYS